MSRKLDLTGQIFGSWTVVEELEGRNKSGHIMWKCVRDSGETRIFSTYVLRSGKFSGSSGLLREENWVEGTSLSSISPDRLKNTNGTSKHMGVSRLTDSGLWVAQLEIKGKRVLYKRFETEMEAHEARVDAEEKYFRPLLNKYEYVNKERRSVNKEEKS